MGSSLGILVFLLYQSVTIIQGQSTEETKKHVVVSLLSNTCYPSETKNGSNLGEEADLTSAELANQPETSLPSSFTICSMAMVPKCEDKGNIAFFSLIDAKGENYISALLHSGRTFRLTIDKTPYNLASTSTSPTVFPEQWMRSCLAVETDTGRLKWVVDGRVVEDKIFMKVKNGHYTAQRAVVRSVSSY